MTSSVMRAWDPVTVSPNEYMTKGKSQLHRQLKTRKTTVLYIGGKVVMA